MACTILTLAMLCLALAMPLQALRCFCDRSRFLTRLTELNYMQALHKHTVQVQGFNPQEYIRNADERLYLLNANLDDATPARKRRQLPEREPDTESVEEQQQHRADAQLESDQQQAEDSIPNLPLTELATPSITVMDNGDGTCEIYAYGKLYQNKIRPVCTVEIDATISDDAKFLSFHLGSVDELNCVSSLGYQCNATLCNVQSAYDDSTPRCDELQLASLLMAEAAEQSQAEDNDDRNLYRIVSSSSSAATSSGKEKTPAELRRREKQEAKKAARRLAADRSHRQPQPTTDMEPQSNRVES